MPVFLEGERIILRPLQASDAAGRYPDWFNDPEVCAANSHHRFPYTKDDALAYIERTQKSKDELALAIVEKVDGRHIGNIALKRIDCVSHSAELVIIIGERDTWGKGYSKEASELLLKHAFFSLNLHRIYCGTLETNRAMQRLAEYLGMKPEGRRRQAMFKQNRFLDVLEYGVLRSEYIDRFGEPEKQTEDQ